MWWWVGLDGKGADGDGTALGEGGCKVPPPVFPGGLDARTGMGGFGILPACAATLPLLPQRLPDFVISFSPCWQPEALLFVWLPPPCVACPPKHLFFAFSTSQVAFALLSSLASSQRGDICQVMKLSQVDEVYVF